MATIDKKWQELEKNNNELDCTCVYERRSAILNKLSAGYDIREPDDDNEQYECDMGIAFGKTELRE